LMRKRCKKWCKGETANAIKRATKKLFKNGKKSQIISAKMPSPSQRKKEFCIMVSAFEVLNNIR